MILNEFMNIMRAVRYRPRHLLTAMEVPHLPAVEIRLTDYNLVVRHQIDIRRIQAMSKADVLRKVFEIIKQFEEAAIITYFKMNDIPVIARVEDRRPLLRS